MGKAEGEFRGGEDVVLKAALEGCTDEEWPSVKQRMTDEGLFKQDYEKQTDAIMDLENMDAELKKDIAEQLKDGTFEL